MENESEPISEVEEDNPDLEDVLDDTPAERSLMDDRALPIRAKPLFHNNNEDVEEFPLFETNSIRIARPDLDFYSYCAPVSWNLYLYDRYRVLYLVPGTVCSRYKYL